MSITIHIKCGQDNWEVTVEPTDTISQLKKTIKEISDIPEESQRLIYSGKILKDPETVESYKIQDGHAIHLVKSGLHKKNTTTQSTSNNNGTEAAAVPSNIATGQTGGFNPLNDLTSARYAGYLNMPSADMFGPDGGMNNIPNQDDMMRMMENPVVQSQLNEMLSNPQMVDFMIQSNPQLQAMGPQARQMLQSPMFRQMLTNPDMMRQSMQFANMMNGGQGLGGEGTAESASAFPAPGETGEEAAAHASSEDVSTGATTATPAAPAAGNPFSALFNPAMNPFANMGNAQRQGSNQQTTPAFDPALLASMFGGAGANSAVNAQPQDDRPPEERYETQLRQLNDMGFFDFDMNVAALRRSGGSVQGALDALLNGSV